MKILKKGTILLAAMITILATALLAVFLTPVNAYAGYGLERTIYIEKIIEATSPDDFADMKITFSMEQLPADPNDPNSVSNEYIKIGGISGSQNKYIMNNPNPSVVLYGSDAVKIDDTHWRLLAGFQVDHQAGDANPDVKAGEVSWLLKESVSGVDYEQWENDPAEYVFKQKVYSTPFGNGVWWTATVVGLYEREWKGVENGSSVYDYKEVFSMAPESLPDYFNYNPTSGIIPPPEVWHLTFNNVKRTEMPITIPLAKTISGTPFPSADELSGMTFNFTATAAAPDVSEDHAKAVPAGVTIAPISISGSAFSSANATQTADFTLPSASAFGEEGVYAFTITESVSGGTAGDWTHDTRTYKLRLYVVEGNDGLEYYGQTVEEVSTGTKTPPAFTNVYAPKHSVTVTKTVIGKYANMDATFPFTIVISNTAATDNITATVAGTAYTAQFSNGSHTISGNLGNGQSIVINGIPNAAHVSVSETSFVEGINEYTPSAVVDGSASGTVSGSSFVALDADVNTLTGTTHTVDVTNTLPDVVPTGVSGEAQLPLAALAAILALSVPVVIATRKRSRFDY